MCERRCNCNSKSCKYCCERNRYESEKPVRLTRNRMKNVMIKNLKEDSNRLLDTFIEGKISLQELEVALEIK